MSLVAGPGRGGSLQDALPAELQLCVEKHVKYIQSLDTVRSTVTSKRAVADSRRSAKMSMSTGSRSICDSMACTGV